MRVRALRGLRFKTSKGEIFIKHGQVFKPSEPSDASELIKAGLVEPVILPPDQVSRPYWQRQDGSCRVCGSHDYWVSVHGVTVCLRCHPPANERLVSRWGTV